MQKRITENDRKLLIAHFKKVVNNDPILKQFPGTARRVFVDRMVEIEKARIEEYDAPPFPPEGYEFTWFPKGSHQRQPLQSDDTHAQAL